MCELDKRWNGGFRCGVMVFQVAFVEGIVPKETLLARRLLGGRPLMLCRVGRTMKPWKAICVVLIVVVIADVV